MFGFKEISIDLLADSLLLVGIAFLLLIGMAVYLYLRTNPPLPRYLRIVLSTLRIIAIVALFSALAEPVIGYIREFERSQKVTLLLDESTSMEKIELNKSRKARRDSLLSSETFEWLKANVDMASYFFGGKLSPVRNKVEKDKTALGDVLYQLENIELAEPSDYWLLLSDGKSNSGRDPKKVVEGVSTPIVAVDISSDLGNFDIGISEINFNPILFVGQPSEIKLKLNWYEAMDKNITVELLDSNRVVNQTKFSINQKEGFGEITFKYIPVNPGQKILKVSIPPLENEENKENNYRSFSVKVLKSKLLTLIVTDKPDYEVGFLKRFLDQSDKYEVELIVTGDKAGNLAGRFPARQTEINKYDLIILCDPDPQKLDSKKEIIKSYLSEKGGAVWVLLGEQFTQRRPVTWFNNLLPFYQSQQKKLEYMNIQGEPSEGNLFHPAIRLADNQSSIRKVWTELPPFQSLIRCDRTDPHAVVLAYASLPGSEKTKVPILGYKRFGPGKLFASAVLPFWSWGFVNLGFGEDNSNYGKFIEGVVSWLTVSDDLDPIRIIPEKKVYHRGETIRFDGYAFDLGFRPIPGVDGTVMIRNIADKDSLETDLIAAGEGSYKAEFFNVTPGEYSFSGQFVKDGQILKQDNGKLLIESFSLEEFDQSGDPSNLMAISHLSGGNYYTFREFEQAVESIDLSPVKVRIKNEFVLWNKYWLLFIFIAAVSLEWLLRKVNQLI